MGKWKIRSAINNEQNQRMLLHLLWLNFSSSHAFLVLASSTPGIAMSYDRSVPVVSHNIIRMSLFMKSICITTSCLQSLLKLSQIGGGTKRGLKLVFRRANFSIRLFSYWRVQCINLFYVWIIMVYTTSSFHQMWGKFKRGNS